MNGVSRKIRLAACLIFLVGCKNVQYPKLTPSAVDHDSVNRELSYHDPLPDTDAGPWIERPRGFERPRALPRKTEEKKQMTDALQIQGGDPAGTNPSASRYPNSVEP